MNRVRGVTVPLINGVLDLNLHNSNLPCGGIVTHVSKVVIS